jgi:uncharacterized protein (TIGR02594 family)
MTLWPDKEAQMSAVYDIARSYLGLQEFPGARHNEQVVQFFADSGHSWVQDDETPWCAAFVGSVLAQAGLKGTGELAARSYEDWGDPVNKLDNARRGDVVVLWRESPDSWKGHVGFYEGHGAGTVSLLGGNQGNEVSVAKYPSERVVAVRRAPMPKAPRKKPTESKTVQASVVAAGSAAGSAVTAISALDDVAQYIVLGFAGLGVLMALWIMRERLRKWRLGDR